MPEMQKPILEQTPHNAGSRQPRLVEGQVKASRSVTNMLTATTKEQKAMHITEMTINGGPPFNGRVEFVFDERVNVFVGPNSTGKTSIIKMLSHPPNGHQDSAWETDRGQFWLKVSEDWPELSEAHETYPNWLAVPFVYVGAVRKGLSSAQVKPVSPVLGNEEMSLNDIFQHCYDTDLFDANLIDLALRLVMAEATEQGGQIGGLDVFRRVAGWGDLTLAEYQLQVAVESSYSCAQAICKEAVTGDHAGNVISPSRRAGVYESPPLIRPAASVETRFDGQVDLDQLSSGIQSSLLWIRFLVLRMVHHYQFEPGWHDKPTILLIDEIENHLHPTWQRRVIPTLLEHFPGLQIFATSHSPFVVAGLKAGQVHLLNRDERGTVATHPNPEDIMAWTADEILRTMMGVTDPTDDETARHAAELRQLRKEGPRSTVDEEEERQARMRELRRSVDRDLLAGGPAAAQRELFERQFARALEQYQRSREMGQENG